MRWSVFALVGLTACGRFGFDGVSGDDVIGDDDDGSNTTGDGGGLGDGGVIMPDAFGVTGCGTTVIIDDTFTDGVVGTQFTAVNSAGYTVSETNGAVTVAYPATANADTRAGYRQAASISFTGICAIAEVTQVPAAASAYAYLRLGTPTVNVEIALEAGMTTARFKNGGTFGNNGSIVYNATNHRFLRIRQAGTLYHFEVAGALSGPYSSLGSAGGGLVQPSPNSVELGGAVESSAAANGAGSVKIERVLVLGP